MNESMKEIEYLGIFNSMLNNNSNNNNNNV